MVIEAGSYMLYLYTKIVYTIFKLRWSFINYFDKRQNEI